MAFTTIWRGRTAYGAVQRALAWLGLLLMLASIVWLELLPREPRRIADLPPLKTDVGSVRCVIIDPGHGGQDSGAMRAGVLEKDLTLDVALRVESLVRATGLKTVMTRNGDEAVSLADRASKANTEQDCVFVSIHFDEGKRATATGVQTYYAARQLPGGSGLSSWFPFLQTISSTPANIESQSLAGFVQEALVARTQALNRGTRAQQFYVVAHVRHPAVLVEGGFLSNNDDMTKLITEDYRQQLATAISDGIMRYREMAGERSARVAAEQPGT